jgi:HEAT repeat protein
MEAPPKPIPKKYIVLACLGGFLLLVVAVAWRPFWRKMYLKTLDDTTAAAEVRKDAAHKLLRSYTSECCAYFAERLGTTDTALREAVVYGLEALGKDRYNRLAPIEHLGDELTKTTDVPAKLLIIPALGRIAEALEKTKPPTKGEADLDEQRVPAIAKPLIAQSEPALGADVRKASLEVLSNLRAPGVCKQLLKIAIAEKTDIGTLARNGIAATAMPETAGELIKTLSSEDKLLAAEADRAFKNVRDSAKSTDLAPLVSDPSDIVRKTIVEALSTRKADPVVQKAIRIALADKVADIRLAAVKAIPITGIDIPEMLGVLVTDTDERVRIANAQTLEQLTDESTKLVVIEAFKQNLKGPTLEAYVKALGRRSSGIRDMKALAIVMPLLDDPKNSDETIHAALVLLTLNGQGADRATTRRGWSTQKWQQWYKTLVKRDERKTKALAQIDDCRKKGEDKSKYAQLMKITDAALEDLDKCSSMCDPDDPEDKPYFEGELKRATELRYLFQKSQALERPQQ